MLSAMSENPIFLTEYALGNKPLQHALRGECADDKIQGRH